MRFVWFENKKYITYNGYVGKNWCHFTLFFRDAHLSIILKTDTDWKKTRKKVRGRDSETIYLEREKKRERKETKKKEKAEKETEAGEKGFEGMSLLCSFHI